jgi:hypothetical protein
MMWILTIVLLAAAAVVGYVIYMRAREGQQPGEALIEGLLNRMRREKKPADPPAHAEPPVVQQVPPGYGPDPVVPPPIANPLPPVQVRPPPVPATVVLPPVPPHDSEGIPMHPLSNAHLFDPMPPDVSPGGFPLKYPVKNEGGKKVPAGPAWYVYDDTGQTAQTEDEARSIIERKPQRSAAIKADMERLGATEYYGPIVQPYQLGDAVFAVNQVTQYKQATGRSLFADLYTGSHAEVMSLWRDADANRNEQLPHDPSLQGVIDSLVQQHRR